MTNEFMPSWARAFIIYFFLPFSFLGAIYTIWQGAIIGFPWMVAGGIVMALLVPAAYVALWLERADSNKRALEKDAETK